MVWYYIAAEVGFLFFLGIRGAKKRGIIERQGGGKDEKETRDAAEPGWPLYQNAIMD